VNIPWFEFAAGAIAVAGCVVIYVAALRAFRRTIAEQQQAANRQLNALAMTVKALQARVAELGGTEKAGAETELAEGTADAPKNTAGEDSGELKPETLAAISAAATVFLGQKAHIRPALPAAQDAVGAWAQQGRVFVQTSHNPRPRA